ncbi:phosphatidylglycerophosphatase A [Sphingobacteriales bacterium UPWRP_1]|nr:phosphatidylglycerophosphatase A [Sphingobacteriales bacterium UPWRP_1]
MRHFYIWISSGLGIGRLPFAPGTWAAAAGVLPLLLFANVSFVWRNAVLLLLITIFTILGARAARYLAPEWGKDPRQIVIDEIAGVWVALLGCSRWQWQYLLAGFVLFRFFDIAKPLGIKKAEQLKNGWGVMADDLLAGLYANILIQIFMALYG